MVKKYKTKPCEIEAVQWTGNNIKEILVFMKQIPHVDYYPATNGFDEVRFQEWIYNKTDLNNKITINTLEGDMKVSVGDYIIKGLRGEFYPCKPDVFEKKYEVIE